MASPAQSQPDEDLVWLAYEGILEKIKAFKNVANARERFLIMPLPWRAVFSTHTLDGQVVNGGFNQYFYNTKLQHGEETVVDFEMIGDRPRADVLRKAMNILVEEAGLQLQMRAKGTVEAFGESYKESKLDEADSAYYKIEDTSPFYSVLAHFIRSHPKDFSEIL